MIVCRNCGRQEEEHCLFDGVVVPDGCVCDVGTWYPNKITDICVSYTGSGGSYCLNCEHEKGCHKEAS